MPFIKEKEDRRMKRLLKVLAAPAIVTMAILAIGEAVTAQESNESVRVRGSESMAQMVDFRSAEFMAMRPLANVVVSGGSEIGLRALLNRECEIAMSSRKMRQEELLEAERKGISVHEQIVGWGGIVILLHPSNPINELTVDQVRKIFSGQAKNWREVGGPDDAISVLTVDENRPGTIEYFTTEFLKAPIAPEAAAKKHFRSLIAAAAEQPNAAGYARIRNLVQLKEKGLEAKVKIVAIKKDDQAPAILPSRESVDNGTYPIVRPYYLYMDAKTGQSAKAFFDFCVSKCPRRTAMQ
jgi:phosphate transport system substrate-binding protein